MCLVLALPAHQTSTPELVAANCAVVLCQTPDDPARVFHLIELPGVSGRVRVLLSAPNLHINTPFATIAVSAWHNWKKSQCKDGDPAHWL